MRPADGLRVALAGGGTGGHLFPGLAVARRLSGGERPLLFGSGKSQEREWVGESAQAVALDAPMLPRGVRDLPRFAVRLGGALAASLRVLRGRRPDLVVGLGGYASVAPGIAALLTGRPLLLLEQNAVLGKANRLLSLLGGRVAASFGAALEGLPGRARGRARVLGNPLRPEILAGRGDHGRFGLSPARPVVLVTGGSQGAEVLNRRFVEAAPALARTGVQVLHLTGTRDEAAVREAYGAAGVAAFTRAFSRDMGTLLATADLVVCRAGGTTLAELAARGRPAVLVPFPHHGDRHQERNAAVFAAAGAARVVPENEFTAEAVERIVVALARDPVALRRMGAAASSLGVPDAAERVAAFAREIAGRCGRA